VGAPCQGGLGAARLAASVMPGSIRLNRGDALAVLTLLGTATLIALPILRGGYLTYVDNAVHLAEIHDLSRADSNGWSEIGFAGFPLGTLHSPLWYPLLAWLVRHGAPIHPIYAFVLVAGFVAPPLAIYWVARRRMSPARAGALAYLVLVQPSMIWGIGSPLGGMWTNALAAAMLIVLADLYARRTLTAKEHLLASFVLGLAVLTHLFVLPLVAILAAITITLHWREGSMTRQELLRRAGGWLVAAAASAKYWLTFVWVANQNAAPVQAFRPLGIAARLLLPADPMYLLDDRLREAIRWDLHLTDALPPAIVVLLGVYGFFGRKVRQDALGRTGFWLASVVLGCLVIHRYAPLHFLGPVSWRLIDWVRFGLALSAMAPLKEASFSWMERRPTRNAVSAAVLGVSLGVWWGAPLRRDAAPDMKRELASIDSLWAWLRENARPEWGRIYLQDTFGLEWKEAGLSQSHVLALTAHHVGMPQLGTYYGIVPYGLRWTLSEWSSLFGAWEPKEEWLKEAMEKTNAGVLVTSSLEMGEHVGKMSAFAQLYAASEFVVWRWRNAENRPVAELTPANHLSDVRFRTGDIRFDLVADYPRTRVLAKTGWHPWWRLQGIPGAWLRESPEGFLVIDDIPDGHFSVHLFYEPSPLPGRVSACGWAFLVAWLLVLRRDTERARRGASASVS
jgi:hypothetical protein